MTTHYLLDGGNVIGEVEGDAATTYLRGVNLISSNGTYYLYNAHGDVVQLTNTNGELTRNYNYDAFGNEREPDETDINPFRYCGEYYDTETGLYYLRARYYDPLIGRFTQEDTHWNTANMIYGDNPQKINEREDALGLKTYSYAPQISAVVQSGNLYVYSADNPILYLDRNGCWIGRAHHWVVEDIVENYPNISKTGVKIILKVDPGAKRPVSFGLADLVDHKSGEVWEVKRFTVSLDYANKQLNGYINGSLQDYPELDLKRGGTEGTHILPALLVRTTQGGSTYYIIYWDHGDGIIFYNYIILKDAKLPFTAAELIELILKGVSNALIGAVVGVGAGALGADLDEAFRRKIMKE